MELSDFQRRLLGFPSQAFAGLTTSENDAPERQDLVNARWGSIGQAGLALLGASGRMSDAQRAALLAQGLGNVSDPQQTAMNMSQQRMMQSAMQSKMAEVQRQQAIQDRLQTDPAFAKSVDLTPEQATLLGPSAVDVVKARLSRDPTDIAYKIAMINRLQQGDARQWQVVGEDEFGRKQYGYPPVPGGAPAGSPTQLPGGGATAPNTGAPTPQGSGSILDQLGDLTGMPALEKLQKLNPAVGAEVKAIVSGNQPFPPRMMGTPHGAMLNALVSVVDPEYNAGTYAIRNKTRLDFNNSTPNSAGGQRQFGNVGLKHMLEIKNNAGNLPNHTNWGPLNTTVNQLDIARQEKSGTGGDVNSYKLSVMNGFDEIAKALGIGDAGGRHELQSKLEAANGPEAINAVIREQAKLLKEKLETLQGRWNDQMGPAAGNFRVIDPEAEKALNAILGEGAASSAAPATPGVRSIRQIQ